MIGVRDNFIEEKQVRNV